MKAVSLVYLAKIHYLTYVLHLLHQFWKLKLSLTSSQTPQFFCKNLLSCHSHSETIFCNFASFHTLQIGFLLLLLPVCILTEDLRVLGLGFKVFVFVENFLCWCSSFLEEQNGIEGQRAEEKGGELQRIASGGSFAAASSGDQGCERCSF